MALSLGNGGSNTGTAGSTEIKFNFDSGTPATSSCMVISIGIADATKSVLSCTYGGQAMTTRVSEMSMSSTIQAFTLDNPPSGTNEVKMTLSATLWNPHFAHVQIYDNCGGIGTVDIQTIAPQEIDFNMAVASGNSVYVITLASADIDYARVDSVDSNRLVDVTSGFNSRHYICGVPVPLTVTGPLVNINSKTVDPSPTIITYTMEVLGAPPVSDDEDFLIMF